MFINIAVTGQMCSGKTAVCKIFENSGFKYYSADEIAHSVLNMKRIKRKIYDYFGYKVFENGKISREKLSREVFKSREKWNKINEIVHPEVVRRIKIAMEKEKGDKVFEVPLLFEAKIEKLFNYIVYVKANWAVRKKNAEKRGFQQKELKRRERFLINSQIKEKKADFIILNNFSFYELKKNVRKIIRKIKRSGNYAED